MKKIIVLGGVGAMAGETTIDLVNTSEFDEIMVADIDIAKAERVAGEMIYGITQKISTHYC